MLLSQFLITTDINYLHTATKDKQAQRNTCTKTKTNTTKMHKR